jgi:16S rRNA (guanine966-N2)-methyltransferase
MRITGGVLVRRNVLGPARELPIRPTPDALREQAFAVLAPELADAVFLDLFAGTGVVSLEAVSRGVARAYLCEQAFGATALIERNFGTLGIERARWELLIGPAQRTLPGLAARGVRAMCAWCDPPFASWELGPEVLTIARECGVLAAGARIVVETPPRTHVEIAGFEVVRQLRGAVLLRTA